MKDVEIKLKDLLALKTITLKTDENGKAITPDLIDVGKEFVLEVLKEGFKGVDLPEKITVNELTAKNKITLKKTLKEVYTLKVGSCISFS